MEKDNLFKLIHTVEQFTNEAILTWSKSFQHNVGISPILVLSELHMKGPQKQTDLANHLGYTPGAITNIANRLIKCRYAVRQYNEQDRRHVLLQITDLGEAVLHEAYEKGKEIRLELFQTLTEEEIHQFLTIHEKLLTKFKE